ncbi:hypothetical protein [Roseateles sp. MS654]|uniref:hypothetical protein n=1 Tax=Roseateles sp. MS654 TaxID=3412685 RepID=UPI003C30335E
MRNLYAISIGLTLAGVGCVVAESTDPLTSVHPSFELTVIGYLLATGGLMLLIACLAATLDGWLKARWRRGTRSAVGVCRRRSARVADHP